MELYLSSICCPQIPYLQAPDSACVPLVFANHLSGDTRDSTCSPRRKCCTVSNQQPELKNPMRTLNYEVKVMKMKREVELRRELTSTMVERSKRRSLLISIYCNWFSNTKSQFRDQRLLNALQRCAKACIEKEKRTNSTRSPTLPTWEKSTSSCKCFHV